MMEINFNLGKNQIHVWVVSLLCQHLDLARLRKFLTPTEKERAKSFISDVDRHRFIVAHAALQSLLEKYSPASEIQINAHGKAFLKNSKLTFNLSHSGDIAVIAFAFDREIGIDVERIQAQKNKLALARRFFSSREVQQLEALSEEELTDAFFTCWTRKEAFLKAKGVGLTLPLDQFDVTVRFDQKPVLQNTRWDPREASQWSLADLSVHSDYKCALAVEGSVEKIDQRIWSPNDFI